MSGHSILPPSGAKAWAKCPMWVTMNQLYPKAPTPESMEGDAAHWVAWEIVAGRPVTEGQLAPNGVTVTDEMIDGGELMADTLRARMPLDKFDKWHVEEPVKISRINAQCWGTPDVWGFSRFYTEAPIVVEVVDYKFGHRYVDAFENEQGGSYGAGVIFTIADLLKVGPGMLDQGLIFNFTVVQPRCYVGGSPVRTWSIRGTDLRPLFNSLQMAAEKALGKNPEAVTNSECRDCAGRHACVALQQAAYGDAETAYKSVPVELEPTAASLELRMLERALERLQARVDGLRETVTAYARQGHPVLFHRVEQGFGRQTWTVPPEQVISLGQLMGVDLSKPAIKTPKQAITAGIDEAVIKAYSNTPMGAIKLVPTNPADARRVFGINS